MKLLHFDPFSGASGDMILGALADVGAPIGELNAVLPKVLPFSVSISTSKIVRKGLAGTKVDVSVDESHPPHRGLAEMLEIVRSPELPRSVQEGAEKTFKLLAGAESAVHGCTPEEVHFHELGGGDTLVDIIGTHWLIYAMDIRKVTAGPVPVGSGYVQTEHGELPVPAPATAELLRGVPLRDSKDTGELTTPTGAALLVSLATSFGEVPPMTLAKVGYGFGSREGRALPNALRVFTGDADISPLENEVTVLETTVDDSPGEWLGWLHERLTEAGALDVSTSPVGMKKSRPGVRVTVIARPDDARKLAELMLRESTTFGVRMRTERRLELERELREVTTEWGPVHVKLGRLAGELVQISPEYEDCRALAARLGIPLKAIYEAALESCRKIGLVVRS